ncbi:MAG: hypothetical protein WCI73_10410, partial [Phycisphaerae bacterium]
MDDTLITRLQRGGIHRFLDRLMQDNQAKSGAFQRRVDPPEVLQAPPAPFFIALSRTIEPPFDPAECVDLGDGPDPLAGVPIRVRSLPTTQVAIPAPVVIKSKKPKKLPSIKQARREFTFGPTPKINQSDRDNWKYLRATHECYDLVVRPGNGPPDSKPQFSNERLERGLNARGRNGRNDQLSSLTLREVAYARRGLARIDGHGCLNIQRWTLSARIDGDPPGHGQGRPLTDA